MPTLNAAHVAAKYGLSDLVAKNINVNYVAKGFQGKRPIVLKLSEDVKALQKEAFTIRCMKGYGAVGLLAEESGMILLEQVQPGISLRFYESVKKNHIIQIACCTMKRLHQAPIPPQHNLPHVKDWLRILWQNWEIPVPYIQRSRQLCHALLQIKTKDVLLHGDLHWDNVLQGQNDWWVIDPKGVVGPSIFDTYSFIADVEKDTEFVANFFRFPVKHIRNWYFVRLILSACWNLEDRMDPRPFLMHAEKAYELTSC